MAEAKVAHVFPGQGSQRVGMGRDLYDAFESARAVFKEADDRLGFPLSKLCFEGPEDELRQTINAQPALVTVSFACLRAVNEASQGRGLPAPSFTAGHSLGEYTALGVAGVFDFATTVYLARERGRLMWEAGQIKPGGMAAILGLDEAPLSDVCRQTGTWIANYNSPGQLVISGAKEDVAKAMELAKTKGALRAVPLPVSGAFHTPLMQPAVDGMSKIFATVKINTPTVPVIANTNAQPLTTAEAIKDELIRQLCNGIQWQRSIEYMVNNGVSTFIEIGSEKVLTGLIRRINKDAKTVNIGNLSEVKEAVSGG